MNDRHQIPMALLGFRVYTTCIRFRLSDFWPTLDGVSVTFALDNLCLPGLEFEGVYTYMILFSRVQGLRFRV